MGEKTFVPFRGNCPGNVSKDAKYSVRNANGKYVIGIYYRTNDGEIWYPISEDHSELVKMVNAVKIHFSGSAGGAFYINEFRQVIVPCVGEDGNYYLAGEYLEDLVFEFEGKIISGNAVDLDGKPIQPGDSWSGPHPGIPYTLAAGGKDIYFKYSPRPRVEKEVRLSKVIGGEKAAIVAKMIASVKGSSGGGFYVNEFCQVFAPRTGDYGVDYVYVGKISLDNWFDKPDSAEAEVAASSNQKVAEAPAPELVMNPSLGQENDPQEKTIEVIEGEIGYSYASLFGPYLKGAKWVKVVDPFIREDHQIRNFRDLCALIEGDDDKEVQIRLHTKVDSSEEKARISEKLDNIKATLVGSGKNLAYLFKGAEHDRWIQIDTGWKIILSRGLDIFQPSETNCGFEELNQSLRSCRGFHITYNRERRR